ncbi:GNAT family N-acetyltransferase [Pedobacter lithocola]|uniref:GNAT family N-acetyltransferase n=1 Tax=Pedobacter lithocola TaxID=1908239 RepID=A0ABV8PDK8_9SPHI
MVNRNFNPFPLIATERLTLRQLSLDDGQGVFALRSNAEVNKYLNREPSKKIEDAINFIYNVNSNTTNNNSVYWAICLTNTQTFIGTICLFDFSAKENSCEIGYELIPQFQGQGLMTEAIRAVIEYAFQELEFQKVVASVHNENHHSVRLLTKLHFSHSNQIDIENSNLNVFTLICSHG